MKFLENVKKYKKHQSNTYKNYYKLARSQYAKDNNTNIENLPSLYDLKVNEFNVKNLKFSGPSQNKKYFDILEDIRNFANFTLPNRGRLVPGNNPCARLLDGKELSLLGLSNHLHNLLKLVVPAVELNYSGCYVKPWYASMSRTLIRAPLSEDNGTTWQWHSDMVPQSAFKLFFYLTDVEEGCAPLTYLVDKNDQPIYRPGLDWGYIGRNRDERLLLNGKRNIPSRVPISEIEKLKNQGCKEKEVYMPAGSFLVWSPNYIHKASFAKVKTRDVLQVQLRPTLYKPNSYWYNTLASTQHNDQFDWWGYD